MVREQDPDELRFPGWVLVVILAIGSFVTTVNVTLLSPLLPDIAAEFAISEAAAGQLGTLTAACAALTAILFCPLIDRYSRRTVLQVESVLLALGTLLSMLAPSVALLAVGRALSGIGGAIIFGVCLAAAGDVFTDKRQRNRAVGIINTASTLGVIFGLPVLTLVTDLTSWRWALGTLAPLALLLFLGSFGLTQRTPAAGEIRLSWLAGYRMVLANRSTVSLVAMMVVLAASWFAWLLYFGAFAQSVVGVSAVVLSILFLVGGGGEIIGNNLAPVLLQRFAVRPLAVLTVLVLGLNLLGVGIVYTGQWSLFPFMAIGSLTSVLLFVYISVLQLDTLPSARGAAMALQSAGVEVGGALGLAGFGLALSAAGDYAAVYRLVGVVVIVVLAPIAYVACRPAASPVASPLAAPGAPPDATVTAPSAPGT